MKNLSEREILELPRKSRNYIRPEDREIGRAKLKWVERRAIPGTGRYQRSMAYEKPNGERFRVIMTEYTGREAAGEASA